uniref:RNA-directed RNA polymerase n=1 Tax=Fetepeofons virus TaxID=3072206 RepID=A0AA96SGD9_9VIRU|nr:MAG: RNA-dependent RNA polymerase [Fetepeofons virus]
MVDNINGCTHSRQYTRFSQQTWLRPHFTYQSCARVEYAAFVERHLTPFVRIKKEFLDHFSDYDFGFRLIPYSPQQVIDSRPPRMRKRYTAAFKLPLDKRSFTVKMFQKNEKMEYKDYVLDDKGQPIRKQKAPRAIQYRSGAATARLAQFTIPYEHSLAWEPVDDNFGFPITTKGRNPLQVGELIRSCYEASNNSDIWLLDHTAFDSSIQQGHLILEYLVMAKTFDYDPRLYELYMAQMQNTVYSKSGIKVKCKGRRMSGDANTSSGNSTINYMVLRYCFPDSIILVNGDDSIIFGGTMKHNPEDCGFRTKIEKVTDFRDISYCQSQPVLTHLGWCMMRDPIRAVSRMNHKINTCYDPDWFMTVGVGESLANPCDPVMQTLAKHFKNKGLNGRYRLHLREYRHMMSMREVHLPTERDIEQYAATFRISQGTIRSLQRMIESI